MTHCAAKHSRRRFCGPRGFTLVEVVLAAFIMSLVFLAMHSVMLLAGRAAGETAGSVSVLVDTQRAIDFLRGDLQCATAVSQTGSSSITCTVPDRTGDGVADTIAYALSSTTLTRTVNGQSETLCTGVRTFRLDFDTAQQAKTATATTSSEIQLAGYDTALSTGDWAVKDKEWIGQYIQPSVPSSATSWRVTRVRFKLRSKGATGGIVRVEVRNASSAGVPTTIVDEVTLLETSLTTAYAWYNFPFANASDFLPGSGACVVLHWAKDADACEVQYQALSVTGLIGTAAVMTTNAGETWSLSATQDMLFEVYGTYTTPDAPQYRTVLDGVRITLAAGADAKLPTVRTAVRTINRPQVGL